MGSCILEYKKGVKREGLILLNLLYLLIFHWTYFCLELFIYPCNKWVWIENKIKKVLTSTSQKTAFRDIKELYTNDLLSAQNLFIINFSKNLCQAHHDLLLCHFYSVFNLPRFWLTLFSQNARGGDNSSAGEASRDSRSLQSDDQTDRGSADLLQSVSPESRKNVGTLQQLFYGLVKGEQRRQQQSGIFCCIGEIK